MKKKIILSGIILLLLGVGIVWYLFNMKFESTQDVKVDFTMTSTQMIQSYDKNYSEANKLYSDKIIEINGEVSEIEKLDSTVNIKMIDSVTGSYIIFSFQDDNREAAQNLKIRDRVVIKGSCSGGIYSDILEANAINFKRCILTKK